MKIGTTTQPPQKITVGFVNDREGRQKAVWNSIKKGGKRPSPRHGEAEDLETWEDWANIYFEKVPDNQVGTADIRVGFNSYQAWSYIGQEADEHKPRISLNLGNIDPCERPTEEHFGFILHEFGHALGLDHEHQSPNRDSSVSQMIRNPLYYQRYLRSFRTEKQVHDQMIAQLSAGAVTSVTEFDPDSIMM